MSKTIRFVPKEKVTDKSVKENKRIVKEDKKKVRKSR